MKHEKNIDKIFKEGFKNFETSPSPHVWENIQKELKKGERNRKPIPLWIKYGSIAALLILFLTIGNFVLDPSQTDSKSITDTNTVLPAEKQENQSDGHEINKYRITKKDRSEDSSRGFQNNIEKIDSMETPAETGIATSKAENEEPISKESKLKESSEEHVAEKSQKSKPTDKGIAATENVFESKTSKREKNSHFKETNNKERNIIDSAPEKRVVVDPVSDNPEKTENGSAKPESVKPKKSILDAIAENKEDDKRILNNEKEKPQHPWKITPKVAPVYYSSLGNGSSIDPDFSNNPQKGDVNMSYGLQVSYAISNRLSVRTGVNNVELGYSTSDIIIGTGPVAKALGTVDYGSKTVVVTALNKRLMQGSNPPDNFGEINLKTTTGDARLIQNISYYEIPLELNYALIDSKFGVNIIGGVSTLFLGNNEISVKSDNFSSVLGEANNLSNVSFSTNIGLGFNYRLSKRFIFNVEPMFKYQLNPYTDSSVNFKPYYLGVYSGLSFKF